MKIITTSAEAVEYAVIALDMRCAALEMELKDARNMAVDISLKDYVEARAYWSHRANEIEADLAECRYNFAELRSILVGLADNKKVLTIVGYRGEK